MENSSCNENLRPLRVAASSSMAIDLESMIRPLAQSFLRYTPQRTTQDRLVANEFDACPVTSGRR